jgi:hypothetical protein
MDRTRRKAPANRALSAALPFGCLCVLCVFFLPACSSPPKELGNPVRLTLKNRTNRSVTGVLLRFDREIKRVDNVSTTRALTRLTLRTAPADTLRAEGGSLQPGAEVVFEVLGRDGPPRPVEGRWIIAGSYGPAVVPEEMELE